MWWLITSQHCFKSEFTLPVNTWPNQILQIYIKPSSMFLTVQDSHEVLNNEYWIFADLKKYKYTSAQHNLI